MLNFSPNYCPIALSHGDRGFLLIFSMASGPQGAYPLGSTHWGEKFNRWVWLHIVSDQSRGRDIVLEQAFKRFNKSGIFIRLADGDPEIAAVEPGVVVAIANETIVFDKFQL